MTALDAANSVLREPLHTHGGGIESELIVLGVDRITRMHTGDHRDVQLLHFSDSAI